MVCHNSIQSHQSSEKFDIDSELPSEIYRNPSDEIFYGTSAHNEFESDEQDIFLNMIAY